ncbi:hypothetical protein BASA62_001957 [Batrachochytrium salamandrivorans]|nr:hypothetical protein BASA62_001957 [Batrachochytrium salamandrivorans]
MMADGLHSTAGEPHSPASRGAEATHTLTPIPTPASAPTHTADIQENMVSDISSLYITDTNESHTLTSSIQSNHHDIDDSPAAQTAASSEPSKSATTAHMQSSIHPAQNNPTAVHDAIDKNIKSHRDIIAAVPASSNASISTNSAATKSPSTNAVALARLDALDRPDTTNAALVSPVFTDATAPSTAHMVTKVLAKSITSNLSSIATTVPEFEAQTPELSAALASTATVSLKQLTIPVKDIPMPAKDILMPAKDILVPVKDIPMPAKNISMPAKDISMSAKDIPMPAKDILMPAKDILMPVADI